MLNRNLAPIALFTYNRLSHVKQAIESLQSNDLSKQSELFIFSDGGKNEKDQERVDEVRQYLQRISEFKKIKIIEKEKNQGLAASVISGISEILGKFNKVIVLEDDLVTSPYFLKFMNDALDFYEMESDVISISGYMYPVANKKLPETFLIKGADCWGWATWKRGWDLFNPNGSELLDELIEKKLTKKFDLDGAYEYTKMLENQIAGKNNSWAIRWHASAFLKDKLTLYPSETLVKNIGHDGSGTHCDNSLEYDQKICDHEIKLEKIIIEESLAARESIKLFFRPKLSFFAKVKKKVRKKISKIKAKRKC